MIRQNPADELGDWLVRLHNCLAYRLECIDFEDSFDVDREASRGYVILTLRACLEAKHAGAA
jgi:hypothetical protein